MNDSVTVQEEMHSFWTKASYISGILSIILFLIYFSLSGYPLWSSILSLIAFIFFACAVLGILKMMNGPLTVTLNSSNEHLLVTYNKNLKIIQEEQFDRKSIKEVKLIREGRNPISSYLLPEAASLKVHFNDTSNSLFLFEFGGRPLFFDPPALQKIQDFLEQHQVTVKKSY